MSKKHQLPNNNISYPWDTEQTIAPALKCPECGNNGQDGTITARTRQYDLLRVCLKCNHTWCGGIGVQRADLSEPLPTPGIGPEPEDPPRSNPSPSFRNPAKNVEDTNE